jgi:Flp pilus assembly pilin Flp
VIRYAIDLARYLTSRLHRDERGQDVMEYALLAGFIGIALAVAFVALPLDEYLGNFVQAIANCVNITDPDYACPGSGAPAT